MQTFLKALVILLVIALPASAQETRGKSREPSRTVEEPHCARCRNGRHDLAEVRVRRIGDRVAERCVVLLTVDTKACSVVCRHHDAP